MSRVGSYHQTNLRPRTAFKELAERQGFERVYEEEYGQLVTFLFIKKSVLHFRNPVGVFRINVDVMRTDHTRLPQIVVFHFRKSSRKNIKKHCSFCLLVSQIHHFFPNVIHVIGFILKIVTVRVKVFFDGVPFEHFLFLLRFPLFGLDFEEVCIPPNATAIFGWTCAFAFHQRKLGRFLDGCVDKSLN